MKRRCVLWLLALSAAGPAWAQETRATIFGVVRDGSGGVMAGVAVSATSTETNAAGSAVTNPQGYYEIPYLMPGTYTVSAKVAGFRNAETTGVLLTTGIRRQIDVVLEVGEAAAETVTVSAEVPLLETTTGSGAASLSPRQVDTLPVFGDAAQLLMRSVPGVQWTGQPAVVSLHSNLGASTVGSAGAIGGVEYTLDGAPNLARDRRVAHMPPTDLVSEVRVESAPFDASRGHTANATVSLLTKSGTNEYHGSLSWGHWQQRWNATPSTTNLRYWGAIAAAEARGDTALAQELRRQERQLPGHNNDYAAGFGGPLKRDKLFFFVTFNGYDKTQSEESTAHNRTVPSEAHRRGDFSDLLALGPQYQIYDPRTARLVNGVVVRDPFPNNQVPILNPIYQAYAALYPLPNNPGTADGTNNYLATETPWTWRYNGFSTRLDWNPSSNDRVYGKFNYFDWTEDRTDWTYESARFLSTRAQNRHSWGAVGDWVHVFGSSTILNVNASYNSYRDGDKLTDKQLSFRPTTVGLPDYLDARAGEFAGLPRVNFSAYDNVGYNANNVSVPSRLWYDVISVRSDLTKIVGTHSVRTGVDLRQHSRVGNTPGNASGSFIFRNDYVRATENTNTAAARGLEWAAFMLGVPQSITIDTNSTVDVKNPALGAYIQDDWRVSPKLTVNLGLRYEVEAGFTEAQDRGLAQFDAGAVLPISAGAEAAYGRILPTLTAAQRANLPSSLSVRGGSTFLGENGSRQITDTQHVVMPRVGFAYQLTDKTVLRGGYGLFYESNNVLNQGIDQAGFSRSTSTTITNDRGLTFNNADLRSGRTIFSDPFPVRGDGTRFNEPLGSQLGLMQVVGGGFDYPDRDWKRARQQRFRLGVQQALTKSLFVEVAYLGSRTDDISLTQRLNPLPEPFWASGNERNNALANDLNANIPNPFAISNFADLRTSNPTLYNDMAARGFYTATTIRKHQLLRAFPHMTGGNGLRNTRAPLGEAKYDHLEFTVEKRFSSGIGFTVSYTRAWDERKDWLANEFDTEPRSAVSNFSFPHHVMANAVVDLPFGKDKRFLQSGLGAALAGGWSIGAIYHWQSGAAYDFPNLFWYGPTPADPLDPDDPAYQIIRIDNPTRDRMFNLEPFLLPSARAQYPDWATNPASLAAVVAATNAARPADFHRRNFPLRFDFLRGDPMNQVDLSLTRRFRFGDRRLELRADAVNLLNTVQWRSNPNTSPYTTGFGQTTEQWNTPRWITFKARFLF